MTQPFSGPGPLLARARERRKVMMRSTCRITRPAAERNFDPATGQYDTPARTLVYEGICQLKPSNASVGARRDPDAAGAELGVGGLAVILPWTSPRVAISDAVEILTSDDAQLTGRVLPVSHAEPTSDTATHRAVVVSVQDRPGVNDA